MDGGMTRGGGLDEGILRITNYHDHPTNDRYKVFFFYSEEQADYFESLLKEANLFYERDETEKNDAPYYLFGIKKKDLTAVYKLNNIAIGKFRSKFISNKTARIFIIIFGLITIAISVFGYIKSH